MQPRQQHLELPTCHRRRRGTLEGDESVPSSLFSDALVPWDRGAEGTGVLPLGVQLEGRKRRLREPLNGTQHRAGPAVTHGG